MTIADWPDALRRPGDGTLDTRDSLMIQPAITQRASEIGVEWFPGELEAAISQVSAGARGR